MNASQDISSYWIRLHGLMDCYPKKIFQAAILRYSGSPEVEPEEILTYENTKRPGKVYPTLSFITATVWITFHFLEGLESG